MRRFTDGTPQDYIIVSIREGTLNLIETMYEEALVNYAITGIHRQLNEEQLDAILEFLKEAEQYREARDKVRS